MAKTKTSNAKKSQATGFQYYGWLLVLIPFVLYIRTTGFDFTYHDDDVIILDGAQVLQRFNFREIFFSDAWLMPGTIELYRPLQSFTFAIDQLIGKQDATVYHVHNVLLFCLCVWLLFNFLKELKLPVRHAFAIAGLYAVHYLFSQAVSWLPARGDLYLTVFSLAALWAALRYINTGVLMYAGMVAPLYFLAMLSKESGIVLPAIIFVLYGLIKPGDLKKPVTYGYFALLLPLAALYIWMQRQSVYPGTTFLSFNALLYNLPVLPEEVFKFFIPLYYSVMPAFSPVVTGIGVLLLLLLLGAGVYYRKSINTTLYISGWVIFLVPLFPSLFYKPVFTGFAYDYLDHRMLFPYVGLFLIVYSLLSAHLHYFSSKYWLPGAMACSAMLAFYYSGSYQNRLSYYENATRTDPKSGLAIMNYARVLDMEKKYDESLVQFNKLVEMFPDSMGFRLRRAALFIETKQYGRMLNECRSIIAIDPKFADAYYYMGGYYNDIGKRDSAYLILEWALKADSTNSQFYFNRATLYRQDNRIKDAMDNFSKAIELNPNYASAYAERGFIYGLLGLYKESLNDYIKYTALKPTDGNGIFFRGQAYCLSGNVEQGCKDLRTADAMGIAGAKEKMIQLCK